jgi:acyl-CoA thioesterase
MASLNHTVIFHGEAELLSLTDKEGNAKWFCVEGKIEHISHGRALLTTRLWDTYEKRHVGSTMQDGLIRLKSGVKQNAGGIFLTSPSKGLPEMGKANL